MVSNATRGRKRIDLPRVGIAHIAADVSTNSHVLHAGGGKMQIELEVAGIKELTATVAELTARVAGMAAEMAALKALVSKGPGAGPAQPQENHGPRVVDIKAAADLAGISEATVRRRLAVGDFPAKVKLSTGRVGFVAAEVIAWVEGRKVAA